MPEVNPEDSVLGSRDMVFKKEDEKVAFERTLGKYQAGLGGRVEGCVPARGELHEPL